MKRRRRTERGSALVLVIFASSLVLLLLMTTLIVTRTSGRALARQLTYQGQASNAAAAGLTESLSWFVRQATQPVTAFNPVVDAGGVCTHVPAHIPPANDSEDPAAGIVRSYEISAPGRVWGRYEVLRTAMADVSTRRGKPAAGTIWQVESHGIVYVRNAAAQPPGTASNPIISQQTMRVELQRLGLQVPNAALSATRGDNISIIRPSRIQGGSTGIGTAYAPSTGTPGGNGTISGNPARNTTAAGLGIPSVFGVSQQELLSMADLVVDDERQLPNPLPSMALIVIRNNATFNATRTLTGSGILVVLGNLVLNPQSNAFFNGVVWVGGTFVCTPPANLNGTVIASGNVQITGGSEVAEINYDPAILDQVRLQMGNYLMSRSPWIVGMDGR